MINFEFLPGGNIIYYFWKTLYEIKLEKKYCCMKSNAELDVIDTKNYTYNNTNFIIDEESKRYFYGLDSFWNADFNTNKISDLVILKFEIKETSLSYPIIIYKTIYISQVYPPYLQDYKISCNPGSCDNFEYAYIPYITFGIPSTTTNYPITSYGLISSRKIYEPISSEGKCILPNIKSLTYVIKGKKIDNTNVEYIFSVSFDNLCSGIGYEGCVICENFKQVKGCSQDNLENIDNNANLNDPSCNNLVYNNYSCCWNEVGNSPFYLYFESTINKFINRIEDVYIILKSLGDKETIDRNTKILFGFEGDLTNCNDICNAKNNNLFPSGVILFRSYSIDGTNYLIQHCCPCS
jgi:hypothetical protein